MKANIREQASIKKLLKLAKAEADELQLDLADVETARKSAQTALDWLRQAIREEETKADVTGGDAPAQFAAYLEGTRPRRTNLDATLVTLSASEEKIREALTAAHIEIQKLDHIVALNDRIIRRETAKAADAAADDLNAIRAAR